jgi:uncharacterized membrane protein YgcG
MEIVDELKQMAKPGAPWPSPFSISKLTISLISSGHGESGEWKGDPVAGVDAVAAADRITGRIAAPPGTKIIIRVAHTRSFSDDAYVQPQVEDILSRIPDTYKSQIQTGKLVVYYVIIMVSNVLDLVEEDDKTLVGDFEGASTEEIDQADGLVNIDERSGRTLGEMLIMEDGNFLINGCKFEISNIQPDRYKLARVGNTIKYQPEGGKTLEDFAEDFMKADPVQITRSQHELNLTDAVVKLALSKAFNTRLSERVTSGLGDLPADIMGLVTQARRDLPQDQVFPPARMFADMGHIPEWTREGVGRQISGLMPAMPTMGWQGDEATGGSSGESSGGSSGGSSGESSGGSSGGGRRRKRKSKKKRKSRKRSRKSKKRSRKSKKRNTRRRRS